MNGHIFLFSMVKFQLTLEIDAHMHGKVVQDNCNALAIGSFSIFFSLLFFIFSEKISHLPFTLFLPYLFFSQYDKVEQISVIFFP